MPPALGVVTVLGWLAMPPDAHGIPAFARKYQTSCTTCHVGYPKLNAFGEAFRLNGYQIPIDDEAYVKDEPLALGAEAYKRVWPDAVWPGEIPGLPPVSFRVIATFVGNKDKSKPGTDFQTPQSVAMLTGGTLGNDIGFYGGLAWQAGGESGIERVFLKKMNLLTLFKHEDVERHGLLNLKLGQFEPGVVGFSSHRRLTATDYLINSFTVGDSPFRVSPVQRGVEVDGIIKGRTRYVVGIVNGNGAEIASSGAGHAHGEALGNFDENTFKDIYARLEHKFGGLALDGSGQEEAGELQEGGQNWRDDSIRVGAWYYHGQNRLLVTKDVLGGLWQREDEVDNRFWRAGVDANAYWKDLNFQLATVFGDDSSALPRGKYNSFAWMVGVEWVIKPWLIGVLRYEEVHRESSFLPSESRVVPAIVIYPRANMRLLVEGKINTRKFSDSQILGVVDWAY